VASTRRPWAMTLRIAQPGELCAMKQSPSMKIRESTPWNTKEQSGRGFNLAATSALGHATAALASAAPELDSTLISKLTDDKRSIVFDGAVRSISFLSVPFCDAVHCCCQGRRRVLKVRTNQFVGWHFLFTSSNTFAVGCIV